MRKILFTIIAIFCSIVSVLAQTPNVDPNYNPCPEGTTYDGAANTCYHPAGMWLKEGGWVFILLLILIPVGIFAGRQWLKKAGVKSERTADSEGGIH
jgi:hypothetical protein